MSLISSAELAALASDSKEPGCEQSRSARSSLTSAPSSPNTGPGFPVMTTSPRLPANDLQQMEFPSMSSAAGFHAKTSATQAPRRGLTAQGAASGPTSPVLLAKLDPDTSSWRTSPRFAGEASKEFSGIWPRSGLMRSGTVYRLPPLVPLTRGIASGLLPTPRHCDGTKGSGQRKAGGGSYGLGNWIARHLGLPQKTTTMFDPVFSELLMGYPAEWTALAPAAMPSRPSSRKSSVKP